MEDDPFELLQHQADIDDWEYACEEEAARSLGNHAGDAHVACDLSDQSRPLNANDSKRKVMAPHARMINGRVVARVDWER